MRFPQMHIATSVVNRILNTHEEMREAALSDLVHRGPVPSTSFEQQEEPAVPDPSVEGVMLNQALAAVQPVAADAPEVALAGALGQSPLDGLLSGAQAA